MIQSSSKRESMLLAYSQARENAIAKLLATNALKKMPWQLFTISLKNHIIKTATGLPLQLGAVSLKRFEKDTEVEKEYYSEGISIDS